MTLLLLLVYDIVVNEPIEVPESSLAPYINVN